MIEVSIDPCPPRRFREVLSRERFREFSEEAGRVSERLRGVTMWNVNSTAHGGGVAEMLRSVLGYVRGAGLDARWLLIDGDPEFFRVTKRLHNRLHGDDGDGEYLDEAARRAYEEATAAAAAELRGLVSAGDVVVLHDPQTAGMAPAAAALGAIVVWRCHVGIDHPNELAEEAQRFLAPYLASARAHVFSRRAFAWKGLDPASIRVIAPSIDAFSAKNRALDEPTVRRILADSGILPDAGGADRPSIPAVRRRATIEELAPAPAGAPLVVQVSRWDRLKDPRGVVEAFVEHVAPAVPDAHLVVAGPQSDSVGDDPEGAEVLDECRRLWSGLPTEDRTRVHLACLPMDDEEENALMVNALQRRADVVVQKSLAEGFGLTVAEAMWKARPVVASRVGGIQDQIEHGRTGVLLDDPTSLAELGECVRVLLAQPERAAAMGRAAREAVRDEFMAPRHLLQYARLLDELVEAAEERLPLAGG